ncbi:MAG: glycine radical domain-containing protein [Hydrogeniiclostridium mannosilyticum]
MHHRPGRQMLPQLFCLDHARRSGQDDRGPRRTGGRQPPPSPSTWGLCAAWIKQAGRRGALHRKARPEQGHRRHCHNVRFTKDFVSDGKGRRAVCDFIRYFMASGCFEVQFNVVDGKELVEAQKHRAIPHPDGARRRLQRLFQQPGR